MKSSILTLIFLLCWVDLYPQLPDYFCGVQTHFGQFNRVDMDSANVIKMLDSVKSAGIKLIRDECYWADVETSPGVFNFPPQIDFYISEAKARSIEILLILNYNNPLYAVHAGAAVITDTNRAKFAEYCKRVVSRYSPLGVKLYEIWNEPNIPLFWAPAPNANDYVKLLKVAYPAVKSVDPSALVMGCATSPAEGNLAPYISWLNFIPQVFALGGGNYMDAVSFHLYRVAKRPELWIGTDYNSLKNIIGNKPMWLTEVGYHTSSAVPNLPLKDQAEYISRLFIMAKNLPQLKSVIYYDLKNDGTVPNEPEHHFGLLNYDLSPKPAYHAVKNIMREIGSKICIATSVQENFYKYSFSGGMGLTLAMWNPISTSYKTELLSSNNLKISDIYGNTHYIYDKDRIVNVKYSPVPVFYSTLENLPAVQRYYLHPPNNIVVVGQKINLSFRGIISNSEILYVDSLSVNWIVDNANGSIDSLGRFTARQPGTCKIIASFNGNTLEKLMTVIPSYNYFEIESFDLLDKFDISYQNMLPSTSLNIIDTNFSSPDKSLKIDYAFRYSGIDKHRIIFDCDIPLVGEPDSILIDVFNNGSGHVFGFQLVDADGDNFSVNTPQVILANKYGWTTTKASLASFGSGFNHPARLKRITLFTVKSGGIVDSIYSGEILIDNLRIHNGIIASCQEITSFEVKGYELFQNFPNPFNPATKIDFSLPTNDRVTIKVFNLLGELISELLSENMQVGRHQLVFNPNDYSLSSGVYFISMEAGSGFRKTIKTMFIK